MGRLARNKAVQDTTEKASIDWNGHHKPVSIATGHLDDVSVTQAANYAEEIDSEAKAKVDGMAIQERGGEGIGYAKVADGEFVDFVIYAQYQR